MQVLVGTCSRVTSRSQKHDVVLKKIKKHAVWLDVRCATESIVFGDIIALKRADKLVREKRWVKRLYVCTHLNFQVTGTSRNYHTYHCNFFNLLYWLLIRKHFTVLPQQFAMYFRCLSSNQQVNRLESRDVTLYKVTSLGQDTSCNIYPDNLLC